MNTSYFSFSSSKNISPSVILFICCSSVMLLFGCKDSTTDSSDDQSNPAIQPRVIFTAPAGGSVGPYDNLYTSYSGYPHLIVRFNKLMERASFAGKVKVIGFDRPVVVTLYGGYYYPILSKVKKTSSDGYYNDLIEFAIRDSLNYNSMSYRIGQHYTVVIDSTVEDINGNHLGELFSFLYTPEPVLRVVGSYPKDKSKNIYSGSSIYIFFNSKINNSVFTALHLSPPVTGNWRVTYDSTYAYFFHLLPFSFNTTYTLTVSAGMRDIYNNTLQSSYSSSFTTVPFQLTSSNISDGQTNVSPGTQLYFGFSGPIDTSTVRSSFTLTPPASGFIYFYPTEFVFTPVNPLTTSTTYTIGITSGLKSTDGTHLSSPVNITFTTTPFQVGYTSPYDGSTDVYRSTSIYVQFNTAIDTASARQAFSISPQVAGTFVFQYNSQIYFSPSSQLNANTIYTVTISTAMKSTDGKSLAAPYSFSFRTGQ